MAITIEKNGLVGLLALGRDIMTQMLANGFTEVSGATIDQNTTFAAFEAGANVDPLAATQPWRIRMECSGSTTGFVRLNVGTPLQIADDRSVSQATGAGNHNTSGFIRGLGATDDWIEGANLYTGGATENSAPLSYRMSISPRGIALCVWVEGEEDSGSKFSWIVIQRPVDNANGSVLNAGKAPVFCVFSAGGGAGDSVTSVNQNIHQFVVREADVNAPTVPVPACIASEDANAIINPLTQVSIAEGNQYVISIPNNLATQRHVYKHELDMIAYTSADVVAQNANVALTLYGEGSARTFTALNANGSNNTGMRILFLTAGGGI